MRSAVNVTKLILLTSCLSLSACDSDGDGSETLRVKDPSGGTSTVPQLAIGTGHGDQFQAGALRLSTPTLAAGGEATVSADIVDRAADNAPFNQSVPVTFTSNCVAQGTATITASVSTGPTGTAQTIYKANGCEGVDTITATINNGSSMASVNITVASADAGSLTSVSATPPTIALQNLGSAGLTTVSEVQFVLRDNTGNPLKGETINFTLSDQTGGITLTNSSGITDVNGIARAYVNSGTVKTTVRVNAELASNPMLKTTSSTIAIGTGVPSQETLSLAAEVYNMPACYTEGYENNITVRVSDYYRNPIADGTKIVFYTSHGQIDPECTYDSTQGGCSVTWRSQQPYPTNSLDRGHLAIMATLKGEETALPDTNGNGLFDSTEGYIPLSEAYLDENSNGQFDAGERFIDWDGDGQYSENPAENRYGTPQFRGVRCSESARSEGHCQGLADLYRNIYLTVSCNVDQIYFTDNNLCSSNLGTIGHASDELRLCFKDAYGNAPAAGSRIEISIASGDGSIVGGSRTIVVPSNIMGPYVVPIKVRPGEEDPTTVLDVTIENSESKLVAAENFIVYP